MDFGQDDPPPSVSSRLVPEPTSSPVDSVGREDPLGGRRPVPIAVPVLLPDVEAEDDPRGGRDLVLDELLPSLGEQLEIPGTPEFLEFLASNEIGLRLEHPGVLVVPTEPRPDGPLPGSGDLDEALRFVVLLGQQRRPRHLRNGNGLGARERRDAVSEPRRRWRVVPSGSEQLGKLGQAARQLGSIGIGTWKNGTLARPRAGGVFFDRTK